MELVVAVDEDAELAAPLVDLVAVVLDAEEELALHVAEVLEEPPGGVAPHLL